MDCKVGFIGFGLIAGSIAHALRESGNNYNIIATSRRLEPVYKAKEDGVVDDVLDCVDDRFANCDFIILCTPVITMNDYLTQLKAIVKSGCILTDDGSVKTSFLVRPVSAAIASISCSISRGNRMEITADSPMYFFTGISKRSSFNQYHPFINHRTTNVFFEQAFS